MAVLGRVVPVDDDAVAAHTEAFLFAHLARGVCARVRVGATAVAADAVWSNTVQVALRQLRRISEGVVVGTAAVQYLARNHFQTIYLSRPDQRWAYLHS